MACRCFAGFAVHGLCALQGLRDLLSIGLGTCIDPSPTRQRRKVGSQGPDAKHPVLPLGVARRLDCSTHNGRDSHNSHDSNNGHNSYPPTHPVLRENNALKYVPSD